VTLGDTNGLLSATGTGVSGSGTTNLTIIGSLAQVNADLATLADTDATTPSDTITLHAADSFGNAAGTRTVAVSVTPHLVPVLLAPSAIATGVGQPAAVVGVNLSESGNVAGETFTVTLADTNGLLSATGTGVSGSGTTSLTVTGSLSQVNADLATLKDTDAVTDSDTITLGGTDGFGNKGAGKVAATAAAAGNKVAAVTVTLDRLGPVVPSFVRMTSALSEAVVQPISPAVTFPPIRLVPIVAAAWHVVQEPLFGGLSAAAAHTQKSTRASAFLDDSSIGLFDERYGVVINKTW
jgi:hypothetical protein